MILNDTSDLHWAPRLQNALADALTNQQCKPSYGDIKECKEKLRGKKAAKLQKGE